MPVSGADFRALAGIITSDLETLRRLDEKLARFSTKLIGTDATEEAAWAVGSVLHSIYSGLENTFSRTAATFRESIEDGARWHSELLARMFRPLPEVHAALLPQECRHALRHLLGFRHFFRNAYEVDLIPEKLVALSGSWTASRADVYAALESFVARLYVESPQS